MSAKAKAEMSGRVLVDHDGDSIEWDHHHGTLTTREGKRVATVFMSDTNCVEMAKNMLDPLDRGQLREVLAAVHSALMREPLEPVPMLLTCPSCGERHIDVGEFATKVHHTHACQHCGMCWRPAVVPTVGVQFLPGFKNEET